MDSSTWGDRQYQMLKKSCGGKYAFDNSFVRRIHWGKPRDSMCWPLPYKSIAVQITAGTPLWWGQDFLMIQLCWLWLQFVVKPSLFNWSFACRAFVHHNRPFKTAIDEVHHKDLKQTSRQLILLHTWCDRQLSGH